jgi:prepilin-type N-terminal cleavage/methylation domain-containing protein
MGHPAGGGALSKRAAFTLIELLVVVAILGLLIGILVPSLTRARGQAKRAVCATNLKQIGIGLQVYLGDSHDRFPYASFMPSVGPFPLWDSEPIFIADVLSPYVAEQSEVFHCPNDRPGTNRPAPNTGLSYFQSERSSYEYRFWFGGDTITEVAKRMEEHRGRPFAENSIWLLRDYDNFHHDAGGVGVRRYLYADGHVGDFEN